MREERAAAPNRPDALVWEADPHLVLKRGQLGRYRVSFLNGRDRLVGDVKIEPGPFTRDEQDAIALIEVSRLVGSLADHLKKMIQDREEAGRRS